MSRAYWLLVLLLPACSPAEEAGDLRFFDLAGFARREQVRLSAIGPVEKTVTLDGKEEKRFLERLDWKAEMDLLAGADINKPAWKDSYRADTLRDAAGTPILLAYESLDPKLRVQRLEIFLREGSVDSVGARMLVSNPLHDTEERISYGSAGRYDYSRVSRRRFGGSQDLRVELRPAVPAAPSGPR